QLAELVAWAKMTVSHSTTTASSHPATIAPIETTLSQPAIGNGTTSTAPTASEPPSTGESSQSTARAGLGVRVMRPSLDHSSAASAEAVNRQPAPRDPFDPEIFN